jgi:hypothetical protein
MIEYEYYDWTSLISPKHMDEMKNDIDYLISSGSYWTNSPPYQTNINIFSLPKDYWINLKMSFIWSCFAYMQQEKQIKSIKSWAYRTNKATQEDRNTYWHQHTRENNLVLSGVYYLDVPGPLKETAGTEFAPDGPEAEGLIQAPAKIGNWIIFPGKSWHRPGELHSSEDRYIVAADMEI